MGKRIRYVKPVTFASNLCTIDDLHKLEKIGSGHDGIVWQYGNQAIKELKYDANTRLQKNLMTFEKAQFFIEWSSKFKRIKMPTDILFDKNGCYTAYVMDLIEKIDLTLNPISNVPISLFLESSYELKSDFDLLNKMHTVAKDINFGSYLFDKSFMHLCDTDKYIVYKDLRSTVILNIQLYNYMLARLLYSLMYDKSLDSQSLRKLNRWVGKCSGNIHFLENLDRELSPLLTEPLGSYTNHLKKTLTK